MKSLILCLTVLSSLVCSTSSPLEYFKDVSDSLPTKNVYFAFHGSRLYRMDLSISLGQTVEECADKCLKMPYLCLYFVVYEEVYRMTRVQEIFCRLFSTIDTKFEDSQVVPTHYLIGINVLAVYEQRDIPTQQDLIKRFSLSGSDREIEQQLSMIANKYSISMKDQNCSNTVLKHLKAAFDSRLPSTVNINRWLKGFDISEARVNVGSDFKLALKEGLQSWYCWPEHRNSPLEFSDIVVLTFIEIFFRNLNQGIETIFDPVAKILIIEGQSVHMMVQTFGPGNYIIVNANNRSEEHGEINCNMFYITTDMNNDEQMKVLSFFADSMQRFGHHVSFEGTSHFDFKKKFGRNNLESGVQVVINAVSNGLLSRPSINYISNGLDVLYRDIVSAVVANVVNNDSTETFQHVLHRTFKSSNLQSKMIDVGIIV